MTKKQITERPCKECKMIIPYQPRRVYCIKCYKLKNDKIEFIDDE